MSLKLKFSEQVRMASEIATLIFDHEVTFSGGYKRTPRVTLQHCEIIDPAISKRRDELRNDSKNWEHVEGRRYERRLKADIAETVKNACTPATDIGTTHEEALSKLFERISIPGRVVQRDDDPDADALVAASRFILKGQQWENLER